MKKSLAEIQKTQKKGFTTFQPLSTPEPKNKEAAISVSIVSQSDSIFEPHLIKPLTSKEKEDRELRINQSFQKGQRDVRNPFARFHNDSNSKAMFSQGSNWPRENQKSAMISQPIRDDSSGSVIESNQQLRENYITRNSLLMRRPIRGQKLYFFKQEKQFVYSKLLWFKPNSKNGRNLVYDTVLHKCLPFFRCGGCFRQFQVPSALGGHLSSCQRKQEHIQSLKRKTTQKQSGLFSTQQQKLRSAHRVLENLTKQKQDHSKSRSSKEEAIFQSSEQKEKIVSSVVTLRQGKPRREQLQRFKRIVINKPRSSRKLLRLKLARQLK